MRCSLTLSPSLTRGARGRAIDFDQWKRTSTSNCLSTIFALVWFGLVVLTVIVKELIVIIVGAKEHTTTVTPRQNKRSKLIE